MLAQQAAARGVKPSAIWHSGKLRAKQTAEAFWRRCNPLSRLTAVKGLQPADPPSWIADTLAGETPEILLVGHFPHLPQLLGLLLTGSSQSLALNFPPHGMVAIEAVDGKWIERWRLPT